MQVMGFTFFSTNAADILTPLFLTFSLSVYLNDCLSLPFFSLFVCVLFICFSQSFPSFRNECSCFPMSSALLYIIFSVLKLVCLFVRQFLCVSLVCLFFSCFSCFSCFSIFLLFACFSLVSLVSLFFSCLPVFLQFVCFCLVCLSVFSCLSVSSCLLSICDTPTHFGKYHFVCSMLRPLLSL